MDETQRQSPSGMALLGEISRNLTFHEINAVIEQTAEDILEHRSEEQLAAMAAEATEIAKAAGRDTVYTVDDLMADRDSILSQFAAAEAVQRFGVDAEAAGETETAEEAEAETKTEVPSGAEDEAMAEDTSAFGKLEKRYGIPKAITQQIKDDYRRYGEKVNEDLFALSYYIEMNRARTGKGVPGSMTEYLPREATENARTIGRAMARGDQRAKAEADAKARSSEKKVRHETKKAPARRVYNRTGKSRKQMTEVQQAVFDACEVLAEVMDTEITLFASSDRKGKREMFEGGKWVEAPFGWFDAQGHIHMDINAEFDGKNVALFTLAHESVHFIKRYAPEDFRRIGKTVVTLLPVRDADIKEMVTRRQNELEARGRLEGLSESEKYDFAFEETVADAMETVLSDGFVLEELILDSRHGHEKNFWKKLLAHLDAFIRRLKELMHESRAPHEAGRMLAEVRDSMRGVRDIYAQALMNAGEARREQSRMNSETMQDTDSRTDGIVRESVRPEYAHELDAWSREGMPDDETFILGETGAVLQGLGAVENDVYINGDKIKRILEEHSEMTLEEIKKIPQILDEPALILKSRNVGRYGLHNTRMAIFGTVKARNGLPVMVIMDLRPFEGGFTVYDMQKVDSAYTKDGDPLTFIKNSYIMYADAKKATPLLRSIGSQTPIKLNESGFIGSISYNQRSVNLFGKSFSDVFSVGEETGYSDQPIDISQIKGENHSDVRYSDRQTDTFTEALQRSGIGTDRYLLANALESAVANEQEYRLLKEYKADLGRLDGFAEELAEVREELHRIRFTKGKRDTEAMRRLEAREKVLAEEVSKRDKKLLSLEAAKPLRDILNREKKKARKQGRTEAEERSRERKARSDALGKRRVIVEIADRWLTMLEKPTKTRNIPKSMEPLALDLLSCINFDPKDAEQMIREIRRKIDEERALEMPDIDRIEKWEKAIRKIQEVEKHNADFASRVAALYRKLENHEDYNAQLSYVPAIMVRIDEMAEIIGDKSLDQLTSEQLQEVRKTVDMVVHAITENKRLFTATQKATVAEASEAIQTELSPIADKRRSRKPLPGTDGRTPKAIKFWKGAYIDELKPIYFFDEIESPTLRRLFLDLYEKSERTFARDIEEIRAFRLMIDKKYKTGSWDRETRRTFETESGQVKLDLGQLMAIYADSKREQAVGHLLTGGFCLDPREEESVKIKGKIPTPIKTTIDDAKAYRLTEEQMWKMVEALTDEQRHYVDEMVEFLSSDMAKKGNEVSMQLYGVELFGEKFYFPIQTKSAYRAAATTQEMGDPMLKSLGMTKPTVPNAQNPLVLSDFDGVWAKHCSDMTSYHALVLPIEDLRRVFEYGSTNDEVGASSTKGAIINAYGEATERYIAKLLTDLNGGLRQDTTGTPTGKLISLMKKSRVMMSASVIVQQPLAAFRAMAMVAPKYFASTAAFKVGKDYTAEWELIKKYADTAVVKDIGQFDVGMGRRLASLCFESPKSRFRFCFGGRSPLFDWEPFGVLFDWALFSLLFLVLRAVSRSLIIILQAN